MTAAGDRGATFLPALRFSSLTPLFDPLVRVTTREHAFKSRLLDQAAIAAGESVLDLGAGTGTFAIMLKQRVPSARVTGLDADPDALSRAGRKAADAGCDVELVEGFSTVLPFEDARFDVALSSLFFHHLKPEDKRATLAEALRVLRPGGRLHVADWGKPSDPAMGVAFLFVRALDGFAVTAENAAGELPAIFAAQGFESAQVRDRLRTPLGTLALYSARKPAG